MARSSAAVKRPPAPKPSAPAGGFAPAGEFFAAAGPPPSGRYRSGGAARRRGGGRRCARRRGRGAQSNASGPLRAARARRLRRRLAELRGIAAVQDHGDRRLHPQDHHPQRFARHFLRPLDQPLSRLRARLHLLLRAADPRLSRAFAGARFRIEAVRQAGGAEAARARAFGCRLCAAHHRDRHQHRSLPADRARAPDHAAHPRGARALTAIRSASSPSRRWWCAISTSSRAWRSAIWSRSRCR